jgi:hypothetical protein
MTRRWAEYGDPPRQCPGKRLYVQLMSLACMLYWHCAGTTLAACIKNCSLLLSSGMIGDVRQLELKLGGITVTSTEDQLLRLVCGGLIRA